MQSVHTYLYWTFLFFIIVILSLSMSQACLLLHVSMYYIKHNILGVLMHNV
jgi:hypothetical protein